MAEADTKKSATLTPSVDILFVDGNIFTDQWNKISHIFFVCCQFDWRYFKIHYMHADFQPLAGLAIPSRRLASFGYAFVQLRPAARRAYARPFPVPLHRPSVWHPSGAQQDAPQTLETNMTNRRNITTSSITWQGITIEVSYEPSWLSTTGDDDKAWRSAHLQIRAISPDRAKLPITETGYRSHFIDREEVEAAGGPGAYNNDWLNYAAQSESWKDQVAASRQLDLFG
jgi:hypothetical protein